jgi:hypothetical protein
MLEGRAPLICGPGRTRAHMAACLRGSGFGWTGACVTTRSVQENIQITSRETAVHRFYYMHISHFVFIFSFMVLYIFSSLSYTCTTSVSFYLSPTNSFLNYQVTSKKERRKYYLPHNITCILLVFLAYHRHDIFFDLFRPCSNIVISCDF